MAIRRPLYYEKNVIDSDGTITQINLKEMADSDITAMRDYCNWVYSRYPITGAVGLGNNADAYLNGTGTGTQKYWQDSWHSLTDTRRIPSTGTDHPHSFQGAGGSVSLYAPNTYQFETFWPKNPLTDTDSNWDSTNTLKIYWDKSDGGVNNRNDYDYPIYRDSDGSGNIVLKSMSQQDMYDTFYADALDEQVTTLNTSSSYYAKATLSSNTGFYDNNSLPYNTPNTDSDFLRSNPFGNVIASSISRGTGNRIGEGNGGTGNNALLKIQDLNDSTYFGLPNNSGLPSIAFINTIHDLSLNNFNDGLVSKFGSGISDMEYWIFMYSKKPGFKQLVRFQDSDRSQGLQLYKMPHRQNISEYINGEEDRTCLASLVGRDMAAHIVWKAPTKKVRYKWQDSTGGPGITRSDAIFDSRLDGSTVTVQSVSGPDNYRMQQWPHGSEVSVPGEIYLKTCFVDSTY